MATLYITSDQPGAGKTALATSLALLLGKQANYYKPFSTKPDADPDVGFVNRDILPGSDTPAPLPYPNGGSDSIPKGEATKIKRSLDQVSDGSGLVLVEGTSLVDDQGHESRVSQELAALIESRSILLIRYRQGLDAKKVIKLCEPFGKGLLGVVINSVTRYKLRQVLGELTSAIEAGGIKVLGVIPEDRSMLAVTVGEIAQHLNGEWVLGESKAGQLVKNFLIGGNILDWGITYFGRTDNKAVIVRGDRPDIQLAALSTPTTCLVLTGGHSPIQYVYYQAEKDEVPVIVVQTGTLSTADALGTIMDNSSIHHMMKVDRFKAMVSESVDLGAIQNAT